MAMKYEKMIAGIAAWRDILHETSGISLDGSFTKKDVFTLISLGIRHLFLPWWPDITVVSVTGMINNVDPGSLGNPPMLQKESTQQISAEFVECPCHLLL